MITVNRVGGAARIFSSFGDVADSRGRKGTGCTILEGGISPGATGRACPLVPVVVSLCGCGQAHKPGVRAGIEEIASISAEAALMVNDVAHGRTKTTFVRVHGAELAPRPSTRRKS